MTDTQHSTLKTQCIWMGESWVWSVNPECRVLSIHHKYWVQALNLWRFVSTLPLKLQHQIHVFEWGILKCKRIHILHSGISNQIHGVLSVECWVSVISLGPDSVNLNMNVLISTPDERPPLLKDKYPNFESGAQMHSYGESILTCVFLYKMKKRCKQITLMNVT